MSFDFDNDIKNVIDKYPKLKYVDENNQRKLKGSIDLIDPETEQIYESFDLEIIYPINFPYCFPIVYEVGNKIPRETDRHVFTKTGNLCLGVDPEEKIICFYGISSLKFIDHVLKPRLADEYLVNEGGEYSREYSHGPKGFWEFFMKQFNNVDSKIVLNLFSFILVNEMPKGSTFCVCNSGKKFKNCHRKIILKFRVLDRNYLSSVYQYLKENPYL